MIIDDQNYHFSNQGAVSSCTVGRNRWNNYSVVIRSRLQSIFVYKTMMSKCEILDPDCRLYRTMKIYVILSVSVTWLMVHAGCDDVYVATRDDVISILFLFAVDAIHASTTNIGTLPREYKYFQPWVTVGFAGNKQQYVYLLGCSTDFLFAGEWCRSRSGIHTE